MTKIIFFFLDSICLIVFSMFYSEEQGPEETCLTNDLFFALRTLNACYPFRKGALKFSLAGFSLQQSLTKP
jgi:hypothetical protein